MLTWWRRSSDATSDVSAPSLEVGRPIRGSPCRHATDLRRVLNEERRFRPPIVQASGFRSKD
jgi:hypothetical protein